MGAVTTNRQTLYGGRTEMEPLLGEHHPPWNSKILLGKGWQQQLSCDREVQEGFAQLFDVKMKMPQCTLYLQRTFLRYIPPLFNFLHIYFGNLWVSTLAV